MFHPEFYYIIHRVNGEEEPLINQESLQAMISVLVVVLSLAVIPIFMYKTTVSMGETFWSLLTPGQKWLEISLILGGIGILLLIKLITDEVSSKLLKKFEVLKEQNAEKAKRIAELEEENAGLNKKIAELEKMSGGLSNINILVEEDSNIQNV
jgi:hypothetical protein